MPLYDYQYTDAFGGEFEVFQHIREETLTEHAGRPCKRTVQRPKVRTKYGEGSNTEPIKMLSIAVDNEDEVDDFRRRNPGVEISRDRRNPLFGVPVASSRSQKLRILKAEGFAEQN